jgi:hypothetical protein
MFFKKMNEIFSNSTTFEGLVVLQQVRALYPAQILCTGSAHLGPVVGMQKKLVTGKDASTATQRERRSAYSFLFFYILIKYTTMNNTNNK